MDKILFITHNTSRTGAPLVLLYFMQWLKAENKELVIDCLSLGNGAMDNEFRAVSNNFYQVNYDNKLSILKKVYLKALNTSPKAYNEENVLKKIKIAGYHVVYCNTVVSLKWGSIIKKAVPNVKLLVHAHELQVVISTDCPGFNSYKHMVDYWVCASKLVLTNLIENNKIPSNKAQVIYEFSKIPKDISKPNKIEIGSSLLVGASGGVNLRKGYDLFIAVAKAVTVQYSHLGIRFEWVGKFPNKLTQFEVESDILKSGLKEIIDFKGEVVNPLKKFKTFDLFLMTSREDPFPLVCIEAGSLGTPIICFEGATGTEEVLKQGGGKIVDYMNIQAMAFEVFNYANNRNSLYLDSLHAHNTFKEFSIENQAPKLYEVLNRFLNEK